MAGSPPAEAAYVEADAAFEKPLDALAHGYHPLAKLSPGHGTIADTVPGVEHQLGGSVHLTSDLLADQMCPAKSGTDSWPISRDPR